MSDRLQAIREGASPGLVKLGNWAKAEIGRQEKALDWCRMNGVRVKAQADGPNASGGFLVPSDVSAEIVSLLETYGAFRAGAQVVKMGREVMNVGRRTSGVSGSFVGEGVAPAQSAAAFDAIGLTARKWASLIILSTELLEDSAPDVGAYLAKDIAQAFAKEEDSCGFNGDGTSTYARMRGLCQIIIDGSHGSAKIAAGSGHNQYSTLDNSDIANLIAGVSALAMPGAKFYVSAFGFATTLCRLAGNSGGMMTGRYGQVTYLGFPVVMTQALSQNNNSQTGSVMMLFGDLSLSSMLGVRRDITIRRSDDRYFDTDQVGLMASERFHAVNHDVGETSTLSPVAGLVGTS